MPLYEYAAKDRGCAHCTVGFTVLQGMMEEEFERCPKCDAEVERLFSAPARMKTMATKKFGARDLERKGFTQFKKVEPGVYEKTAGVGPRILKA